MRQFTLTCPVEVRIAWRGKPWRINLNNYRNEQFIKLNKAKQNFRAAMVEQISALPRMKKIRCSFVLYRKNAALCDTSNICTIVEKFLMDALVTGGKIPDDNYTVVIGTEYLFGGIDRKNERVDVKITAEI